MSENVQNLILEHLKKIQGELTRISSKQDEHTQRLGRIEIAISSVRRDIVHNEESWSEQSVRIDHISERLERIERRLEISG